MGDKSGVCAVMVLQGLSSLSLSRVLVVGSINVDLYKKLPEVPTIQLSGPDAIEQTIDLAHLKGRTLPAKSLVETTAARCEPNEEERLMLTMQGPFEQRTGGKGANSAAAAANTAPCELIANLGASSASENSLLLADLAASGGGVKTSRCLVLDEMPTGTAYIMLYHDRDNCIVLLGGANQQWPTAAEVTEQLREPMTESAVVMLQREVPEFVNVAAASLARSLGKPVFMDVGGTDAPLDPLLLPHIDLISPNEAELSDISGVDTTGDEGSVSMILVRQAVAALKEQLRGAGNPRAEVLVTLGSLGAVHFCSEWANAGSVDSAGLLAGETRSGCFRLATSDGRPLDTTGAGDCFRGSFAAARYVERRSLEESMRWAAAAASLAIEAEGALTSMPSRDQIEKRAAEEMDVPML